MIERAGLPALRALDDPMLAPIVYKNVAWTVRRILAPTSANASEGAVRLVRSGSAVSAIAIDIPRAMQRGGSIEIHGTAFDTAHTASDLTYRGTLGASNEIAIKAIAASVQQSSSRIEAMAIASIEYKSPQQAILDWRSPRFTLAWKQNQWGVRAPSIPFVLRPEDAPIAYVEMRSSERDAMLYPSNPGENLSGAPDKLAIGLRSSPACPAQSAIRIDVEVKGKRITLMARAGHEVTLPFAHKIRSLSVRGTTNRCRVEQRLTASVTGSLAITALDLP